MSGGQQFSPDTERKLDQVALVFSWLFVLAAVVMAVFWAVAAAQPQDDVDVDGAHERELFHHGLTTWFQITIVLLMMGLACQMRVAAGRGK